MLTEETQAKLDWEKTGGLIPAIVQDAVSGRVLMLGYMNKEALKQTLETKKVTFFSRTKNRLWTKGETSGNFLHLVTSARTATTTRFSFSSMRTVPPATSARRAASAASSPSGSSCAT